MERNFRRGKVAVIHRATSIATENPGGMAGIKNKWSDEWIRSSLAGMGRAVMQWSTEG